MSAETASIFSSRAARVTLVMSCLFATTGVTLVFLPRWLEVERGLSGAEIGAVLSLAQLARIFTGPAIAFWADGVADRRTPFRLMAIAAIAAYAAFFLLADGFWQLLALGFLALSLVQALVPLIEAATLRATASGKMNYGVARGIGSVAFIFANVAGGFVVAQFGVGAIVIWVLAGLAAVVVSSWTALLPDPSSHQIVASSDRFKALIELLRTRRFLILIFACGLIQSGHAFYYGFSVIVWRGQGVSAETIGFLWAIGVAVEVAFLWTLGFFERRFSPETMIIAGAGGGVLRWIAMGFAPTGWALWPLQALHALSFAAAHVGVMRLLHRDTPEAQAAMAQTLYAALSGGILIGASTLLSGVLYDAVGARGYWAMALIVLAGGALALLLLNPAPRVKNATQG
ncbi:MFS transporter [Vitreimonas flagellata]|uniref:MFS transporter n=1 Tax=Vitreimonas flagellata TaxID=2560861 RepID=UPI001431F7C4|nr:MFS transporter [Vitreimonas flagellata]